MKNIEEKIWEYIDGSSTAEENAFIERMLTEDVQWKKKYNELLDVHQLLKKIDLDEPSMRFTQNVIDEISRLNVTLAPKKYVNQNVIWGITIFFLTTILGLLAYTFGQVDWSKINNEPNINYKIAYLDWSKLFNGNLMNIVVIINIMLALMLVEMYLSKKKKMV